MLSLCMTISISLAVSVCLFVYCLRLYKLDQKTEEITDHRLKYSLCIFYSMTAGLLVYFLLRLAFQDKMGQEGYIPQAEPNEIPEGPSLADEPPSYVQTFQQYFSNPPISDSGTTCNSVAQSSLYSQFDVNN